MKKLLLLALLVIGCAGGRTAQIVKTFSQNGTTCFYVEDNSSYGYETGVYCKQ